MREVYLDSLSLLEAQVGYGDVGMHGTLGYEGKQVSVRRQHYAHSLSTHPPARLRFRVDRGFASFSCQVALNDDVPAGASHADFIVIADGREVAIEPYVRAGEPPRMLRADVSGAEYLELLVRTSRWEYSHAVWLDPRLDESSFSPVKLVDCLGRAEITVPSGLPVVDRCIATVVSPGFEALLDDMLGSLFANSGCHDALILVFVLDGNEGCDRIIGKYGAVPVRCHSLARLSPASKSVLYSVPHVVDARHYCCLDADMIVLGDLRPIFSMLEACPEGKILACREGNSHEANHLGSALRYIYDGGENDVRQLEMTPAEEAYSLVVNDGLFAGSRPALLALDGAIRAMPQASSWADGHPRVAWRNQFIFNLALARLQCGVELDSTYNVQLHVQDVEFLERGPRLLAYWRNREASVLHFSGGAKRKYPQWQGRFASTPDPLPAGGATDAYSEFLQALRTWIGRYGVQGLAWSFYGLSDAEGARVRDPSTLPLLATLHYLIRSNGCVRVLETGTARGISAACLASAVAHREGGLVVTLDPHSHSGREDLWAILPESHRRCIEAREIDAVEGMQMALDAGETYEAALLDSLHTGEQVWAEFQLAARLVCTGGLILVHDAIYTGGSVQDALARIQAAGYNVVRLWAAQSGMPEDDHLGLAIIENSLRHPAVNPNPRVDPPGRCALLGMEDSLGLTLGQVIAVMQNRIMTESTYFGIRTLKSPIDFWVYKEILYESRADVIIEIGNYWGGSTLALAHLCDAMDHGRVIGIDVSQADIDERVRSHKRVTLVEGDACASFPRILNLISPEDRVIVVEDSSHTFENTLAILETYSPLIKPGGYFIVEDGICHHGVDGGPFPGPYEAVEAFVSRHSSFVIDRTRESFLITWNPKGYLRRLQ